MYIEFYPHEFFANYFWSLKPGSKIKEEIFVKTYLSNFFTFKDFVKIYKLVGETKLLNYADELKMKERVEKLIKDIKKYDTNNRRKH